MGRGIIARDGHGVLSATYWFTGSRPGATTGGRPITGVTFSAVAEVHVSASVIEDDSLVAQSQ